MTSMTQPDQPRDATPTAHDAAAALTELLDSIDGEPEFADLRDEAFWSVRGRSRNLTGRLYTQHADDKSLELLERLRQKFGGEVQATSEKYADNWVWYALTTTEISGVPVVLKVLVPQPDVEQELRARIAELEAALDERGQPVPFVLTDKAESARHGR